MIEKEKINQFLNDRLMSESVFEVLQKAYLKPKKDASVEEKAASFIAVERLQEAWKELKTYQHKNEQEGRPLKQVGM